MLTKSDIERLSALAGVEIDPAFVPGVTKALETLLAQGRLLTDPPLAAAIEPAAIFRA